MTVSRFFDSIHKRKNEERKKPKGFFGRRAAILNTSKVITFDLVVLDVSQYSHVQCLVIFSVKGNKKGFRKTLRENSVKK